MADNLVALTDTPQSASPGRRFTPEHKLTAPTVRSISDAEAKFLAGKVRQFLRLAMRSERSVPAHRHREPSKLKHCVIHSSHEYALHKLWIVC